MKKKLQNRKGFTLIELLVAIVILAIIVVLSIPQISNLIDSNSDRIFDAYEETIRTSGKLYTDAYNQDMFGNNTSGCYDIEYSAMEDKKLIKDVNIHNATCNGGSQKKTFVRVYKSGDVYKYKVSKTRKRMRRSHNAMEIPGMAKCPSCGEMITPHRVCPNCGTYKGKKVVETKDAE